MLHLRPLPHNIEIVDTLSGIYVDGVFLRFGPTEIKMFQLLYEQQNKWVSVDKIIAHAEAKLTVVRVLVCRIREIAEFIDYEIINKPSLGYMLRKKIR